MRNRSLTPARNENDFINAGTAGVDSSTLQEPGLLIKAKGSKAKPISISFAEENLESIDRLIKNEVVAGNARVNRSDIVRAAILSLERLTQSEISELVGKVKLK